MKKHNKNIAVFIASPNDLANERRAFKEVIDRLNTGFGEGAGVFFEALGWEDALASTGRRVQSVINKEIDRCDIFILAMFRRWGQEAPDAKPYTSYTEEEFYRAMDRWKKEGKPEIFVFFRRVDALSEADPGKQLKKVMAFRKELEETREVLYRYFDDEKGFADEVQNHLKAYVKGELPVLESSGGSVVLPDFAIEEIDKAKKQAEKRLKKLEKEKKKAQDLVKEKEMEAREYRLKLEAHQLEMAKEAADLSRDGRVEAARQKFAKLVAESGDLSILSLAFEFYYRTGDLDAAFKVLEKWLGISGPEGKSKETAAALGNLGILYGTCGELEKAEEMFEKALAINEALGRKEGLANQYGNLGNLYFTRGDLEKAEEMYNKSLAIEEALGRKEGLANDYGNLGLLYATRGDLEKAEEMYKKSLAIDEALGRKEGMASDYGNLGNLYRTRGEFEKAEEMYKKSLAIDEALGRKEGLANQYGNLGNLYRTRGDLAKAEESYKKSLKLFEELGSPNAARVRKWLKELQEEKAAKGRA